VSLHKIVKSEMTEIMDSGTDRSVSYYRE
jgi:hypothetical protein